MLRRTIVETGGELDAWSVVDDRTAVDERTVWLGSTSVTSYETCRTPPAFAIRDAVPEVFVVDERLSGTGLLPTVLSETRAKPGFDEVTGLSSVAERLP